MLLSMLNRSYHCYVPRWYVCTQSSEYAIYMDSTTAAHAPQFTTNLWYAPNSSNWYYNGASGNSLSTWNALSYVGTDNYANPLFTDAPSDLSLQSGSPDVPRFSHPCRTEDLNVSANSLGVR